jgi:hypothetical protein
VLVDGLSCTISNTLLILHIASSMAIYMFFSDYNAPFKIHVGKVVSDPDIDADIPSVQ